MHKLLLLSIAPILLSASLCLGNNIYSEMIDLAEETPKVRNESFLTFKPSGFVGYEFLAYINGIYLDLSPFSKRDDQVFRLLDLYLSHFDYFEVADAYEKFANSLGPDEHTHIDRYFFPSFYRITLLSDHHPSLSRKFMTDHPLFVAKSIKFSKTTFYIFVFKSGLSKISWTGVKVEDLHRRDLDYWDKLYIYYRTDDKGQRPPPLDEVIGTEFPARAKMRLPDFKQSPTSGG